MLCLVSRIRGAASSPADRERAKMKTTERLHQLLDVIGKFNRTDLINREELPAPLFPNGFEDTLANWLPEDHRDTAAYTATQIVCKGVLWNEWQDEEDLESPRFVLELTRTFAANYLVDETNLDYAVDAAVELIQGFLDAPLASRFLMLLALIEARYQADKRLMGKVKQYVQADYFSVFHNYNDVSTLRFFNHIANILNERFIVPEDER